MSNTYHHDEYRVLDFVRKHDIDGDICKNLQLVFDHDFNRFRDLLTNTLEGTGRVVWVFEGWLREQLRDGGNYAVTIKEHDENVIEVFCDPRDGFSPSIQTIGTSDLDALIKAYEQYKNLHKKGK